MQKEKPTLHLVAPMAVPTHKLGRNKEAWPRLSNKEERRVLLKQLKLYGWSDLLQSVSTSRS